MASLYFVIANRSPKSTIFSESRYFTRRSVSN